MNDTDNTQGNTTEEMCSTLELRIDEDYVSVPLERYDELLRAEAALDIIVAVYRANGTYCLDNIIKAAFPEDGDKDDA